MPPLFHTPHNHRHTSVILLGVLLFMLLAAPGCNFTSKPAIVPPTASPVPQFKVASPTTPLQIQPSSAAPSAPPSAAGTQTVNAPVISGTQPITYWFEESDCACGSFPAQPKAKYGPGVLECSTAWSGTYIDDDSTFVSIVQYNSPEDLDQDFADNLGWIQDTIQTEEAFIANESPQEHELFFAIQEPDGLLYVVTGPGGGSSKTNTDIPMCGNGSGVLRVGGKFLVKIRLFACDLGSEREVYRLAIETLGDCALRSIERALAAQP